MGSREQRHVDDVTLAPGHTHATWASAMPADVAEFCPVDSLTDWLAVGMYELDEATSRRRGRVQLLEVDAGSGAEPARLGVLASYDCAGVFDIAWRPPQGGDAAAVAAEAGSAAIGALAALALADGACEVVSASNTAWTPVATAQDAGGAGLATSCAWEPRASAALCCSSSSGELSVLDFGDGRVATLARWSAHALEAWHASYDAHQPGLVYSGGDDAAWKAWDLRTPCHLAALADRRSHGAGVCCVASHPALEHVVATGSYDEHARVWDCRQLSRPVCACQARPGAGVWRIKWAPHDPGLALVAAMQSGFWTLRVSGLHSAAANPETDSGAGDRGVGGMSSQTPAAPTSSEAASASATLECRYHAQRVLAYGADWWRGGGTAAGSGACTPHLVATASFYDKSLHLWEPGSEVQRGAGVQRA